MTDLPPVGWYPDPTNPDSKRFWDGRQWTALARPAQEAPPAPRPATETAPVSVAPVDTNSHVAPIPAEPAPIAAPRIEAADSTSHAPVKTRTPWWRERIMQISLLVGVGLLIAVAAVAVGGGGGESNGDGGQAGSDSDVVSIRGTFTLMDAGSLDGGIENCRGDGGYSDFGPGMNVTVKNASGEIIGSSQTRNGSVTELVDYLLATSVFEESDRSMLTESFEDSRSFTQLVCPVIFDVDAAPSDFYEVSVGGRGTISMSASELAANDYGVGLRLGD